MELQQGGIQTKVLQSLFTSTQLKKKDLKAYIVFNKCFILSEKSFSDLIQVISARKGEFETGFEKGGQTQEHTMLAKTAGVKHLIVLINKMDDPTVNWSLERSDKK